MSPRALGIVVRLTLVEALRRRLLWALVGLTILIVAVTSWTFQRVAALSPFGGPEEQLVLSQLLVMIAFMFSFVLAMTAVFAGGPAIADEIASGQALALLARPLRRSELLLGKWLGLGLVLVVYAIAAGSLELAVVGGTTGYVPRAPVAAVAALAGEGLILLTLAFVFSTRIGPVAGGAISVVLFGLAWVAGVMGGVGRIVGNEVLAAVEPIARLILPSDVCWRAAVFGLEPTGDVLASAGQAAVVFRVSPFFAAAPPDPVWLAWSAAWVVLGLAVAALLLRNREI
jgi:ABC-2 type transport system permease protein